MAPPNTGAECEPQVHSRRPKMRCSRRGRQFRPLTLALQLRRRRPRVRSLERWRQLMRRPVHSYRPEEHLTRNSNLWE